MASINERWYSRIGSSAASLALAALLVASSAACARTDTRATGRTADEQREGAVDREPGTGLTAERADVRVTDVKIGKSVGADNRVIDEVDNVTANEPVHISVELDGNGSATLTARVKRDEQVVEEKTQNVNVQGPQAVAFQISKPGGWAEDDYQIEVLLNGEKVEQADFEVRKSGTMGTDRNR